MAALLRYLCYCAQRAAVHSNYLFSECAVFCEMEKEKFYPRCFSRSV